MCNTYILRQNDQDLIFTRLEQQIKYESLAHGAFEQDFDAQWQWDKLSSLVCTVTGRRYFKYRKEAILSEKSLYFINMYFKILSI